MINPRGLTSHLLLCNYARMIILISQHCRERPTVLGNCDSIIVFKKRAEVKPERLKRELHHSWPRNAACLLFVLEMQMLFRWRGSCIFVKKRNALWIIVAQFCGWYRECPGYGMVWSDTVWVSRNRLNCDSECRHTVSSKISVLHQISVNTHCKTHTKWTDILSHFVLSPWFATRESRISGWPGVFSVQISGFQKVNLFDECKRIESRNKGGRKMFQTAAVKTYGSLGGYFNYSSIVPK